MIKLLFAKRVLINSFKVKNSLNRYWSRKIWPRIVHYLMAPNSNEAASIGDIPKAILSPILTTTKLNFIQTIYRQSLIFNF